MKTEVLAQTLKLNGVDVSSWGKGEAKSVTDLAREIMNQESFLRIDSSGIYRVLRVARIEIRDPELGIMIEKDQTLPDGRVRERNQVPAGKIGALEEPEVALARELVEELALTGDKYNWVKTRVHEERRESKSFPGFMTLYELHTFRIILLDRTREDLILGTYTIEADGTKHTFTWRK